MSSEKTSNPNYRLHKKLMRRRAVRESWPLLVWLGMAALAVWAYRTGGDFERMRGVVSKPIEMVGAPIPGKLVPLPTGYNLSLMSVATPDELSDMGESLVIVALVGNDLHIRIFDDVGQTVVDKAEAELVSGQDLTDLKMLLNEIPFPDGSSLSDPRRQKIVNKATSISGHTLPTDLDIPRDEKGQPKELEQGTFVNAGQVVAKIDDTLLRQQIEAEKQTAQFELAKLQLELGQQVQEFQDRVIQLENERQLLVDRLEGQKSLRDSVKTEVGVVRTPSELQEVETAIRDLESELSVVNHSIEVTEKLVATSIQSIDNLRNQANLAPGESATIQLLEEQVRQAVVRATHSGFIDKIWALPGSQVRQGDPIMEIVIQEPKTITALIPEANALTLKRGDEVYIAIPNNRKEFVTATVVSLQQSLTQLPDYGSPIRGRMVRGRTVEFGNLEQNAPDSQLPLLPGSEVVISLEPPGRIPFLSWFTE